VKHHSTVRSFKNLIQFITHLAVNLIYAACRVVRFSDTECNCHCRSWLKTLSVIYETQSFTKTT